MKRLFLIVTVLALLLLAAAGAALWWADRELSRPFPPQTPAKPLLLEFRRGQNATQVLDELEKLGVLKNAALTRLYLIHVLGDPPLQAGEYQFDAPLTARQVLAKLIRGEVLTLPVTVIEGLTFVEAADAIVQAGFADREALLAEMRNPQRIRDLDPQAENLEGYLYPDTYHFARKVSAQTIVDTMVGNFRRHYERDLQPLLAGQSQSLRHWVILASIVEKETQKDDERPLVASVYANRLQRQMGLYADPTIIYGLKMAGVWDGNLRKADLRTDAPYNTYVRPGLPPGPICSPSIASLLAAAQPAATAYLYFVSRNDGTHVFAETLGEHNRNVEIWQRRYWRDRWAAAKRNQ